MKNTAAPAHSARRPFSSVSESLRWTGLRLSQQCWERGGVGQLSGFGFVFRVGGGDVMILGPPCGLYRSSLSTRPPGCSGLESGKKAAFTSSPRSVSAA